MDWNFATTLIGSLPYRDPVEAVDKIINGSVDCPSWPQLSGRGYAESMYLQTGEQLPGLNVEGDKVTVDLNDYDPTEAYMAILEENVDYFRPNEEHHAGLFELLKRDVSDSIAVKGQVTGPISEGLQVQDVTGRSVIYDESYSEIVRKTVNMAAKWQARELKKMNDHVIIFFDEPSLSLLGTPFASISDEDAKKWINEAMEGVDCHKAIHCCGNTNWTLILSTDIDILNFDAYAYGKSITLFPEDVKAFLERGGTLAWGIVPNSEIVETITAEELADKLDSYISDLIAKGVPENLLVRQSMITPQCGLGGTDVEYVDIILALLADVSAEMKRRHVL